jgi:hypothetical protein
MMDFGSPNSLALISSQIVISGGRICVYLWSKTRRSKTVAGIRLALGLFLVVLTFGAGGVAHADVITVVQQMPATPATPSLYQTNRAPLQPAPLMKLPPGSVFPEGWLREQLVLDAYGLPGRMQEISEYLRTNNNGWVQPGGTGGWEEVPYWLRGYEELGYALKDQAIVNDAVTNWLQKMLLTQVSTGANAGAFGPSPIYTASSGSIDVWPMMPACEALRHYYDYSGNPAVISFMTNYFAWLNTHQYTIGPGWANTRWGDHLETMFWLYNLTGQQFLLTLATNIQNNCGGQWLNGTYSWHNVNFSQGFREPAEYWLLNGQAPTLAATEGDYEQMLSRFGAYPGGGISGDEVCRPGYDDPRQGFETCGHVEMMKSFEILTRITGNPLWADRCEDVAFNRLPTTTPPDHSGVCYVSAANSVQIDNVSKVHDQFNNGTMKMLAFMPGCDQYRCCPHNYAMGWPYFSEELWLATADNGLCASLYAPSLVQAKAGDGSAVTINEVTDYPFSNTVNLTITLNGSQPLNFPLYLRVPRWCVSNEPSLQINGSPVAVSATPLSYIKIQRAWNNGDTVTYQMPMHLGVTTWTTNKNAVSINFGPLDFALPIQENWSMLPLTDPDTNNYDANWPGYQVLPGSAWNYGLALDPANPTNGIQVARSVGPLPSNPFVSTNPIITLKVLAKQIPQWTADVDGVVAQLQSSPTISSQPTQSLTLVPMGSARLRISAFPTIGTGTNAHAWSSTPIFWPVPVASYCNPGDTVNALCDGIEPASSSDTSIQRFTWYNHFGTTEWVEYDYPVPVSVSSAAVYWYNDGGGVRLPSSWELLYQDPFGNWAPVPNSSGYGTQLNSYNTVNFSSVSTRSLRLQAALSPGASAGILEWKVPIDGVSTNPVYVDLRANHFSTGGTIWTNLGVFGNFTGVAAPVLVTNVSYTGIPGVYFNGNGSAFVGPNTVPAIDGNGARSVEVWAYKTNFLTEETALAEGTRGVYAGNLAINWSPNTSWGAAAHWADDVGWPTVAATPSLNQWHYLVYTYDGNNTCLIYVDGGLVATGSVGVLNTASSEPILIGAQRGASNGPPAGQWFQGFINSVRETSGVMSSNAVAANYAMGPLTAAARPVLSLIGAGGNSVSCNWRGWANTWHLCYATNLAAPITWFPMTNSVGSNSGQFQMTAPTDSGARFYQLISP